MSAGVRLILKLLVQFTAMIAVYGALLFGAAGTFRWPSAWTYLAIFGFGNLALSLWLAWADPALLAERMKPPGQKDQKAWDKLFFLVVGLVFLAWVVLLGLDARHFKWSDIPVWAQVLGLLMTLGSFLGIAWVYRTNSFATAVIRMQPERKQKVISTGPYAYVRHPMYAFGLFSFIGMPLALGSLWGLAALPIVVVFLHLRILGEERMLRAELEGYEDYGPARPLVLRARPLVTARLIPARAGPSWRSRPSG